MSRLGVLSLHLDGSPCGVACPFCYLGARVAPETAIVPADRLRRAAEAPLASDPLLEAAARLDYAELAIAVNEPVGPAALARLGRLLAAAAARGRPRAVTTTAAAVLGNPMVVRGATRLNLSLDPWKLPDGERTMLEALGRTGAITRAAGVELMVIATLSTPAFAEALIGAGGRDVALLERLVNLPVVDGVALNALKPPPPFCDRAFWLDALARLRPLLDRALDRRLFLDCYVAARLLRIGACPARPDLTPTPMGVAFRSCVYAARPDVEVAGVDALDLSGFVAPAACPFDTRL